jgi:hypothetical protein
MACTALPRGLGPADAPVSSVSARGQYSYYVMTNATYASFPYVMGCLGPGTRWKNGTTINYARIRGNIDTTCYA